MKTRHEKICKVKQHVWQMFYPLNLEVLEIYDRHSSSITRNFQSLGQEQASQEKTAQAFPDWLNSLQSCNVAHWLPSGTTPSFIFEYFHDCSNLKHSDQNLLNQSIPNQTIPIKQHPIKQHPIKHTKLPSVKQRSVKHSLFNIVLKNAMPAKLNFSLIVNVDRIQSTESLS